MSHLKKKDLLNWKYISVGVEIDLITTLVFNIPYMIFICIICVGMYINFRIILTYTHLNLLSLLCFCASQISLEISFMLDFIF